MYYPGRAMQYAAPGQVSVQQPAYGEKLSPALRASRAPFTRLLSPQPFWSPSAVLTAALTVAPIGLSPWPFCAAPRLAAVVFWALRHSL